MKRDLLLLIGLLQHTAFVVRPGRAFMQGLIDLTKCFHSLDHPVRSNLQVWLDICWWHTFINQWNGCQTVPARQQQVVLTSVVSGSWGCGAFSGTRWIQLHATSHAAGEYRHKRVDTNRRTSGGMLGQQLERNPSPGLHGQCSHG